MTLSNGRFSHFFSLQKTHCLHVVLRVNHAGELGAEQICRGQLAVLGHDDDVEHILQRETIHLNYFQSAVKMHGARPSFMLPAWRIGAFYMGWLSAKLSREYAMICTEVVEDVIEKHYASQLQNLPNDTPNGLREAIARFRLEEIEHGNIGKNNNKVAVKIQHKIQHRVAKIAIKYTTIVAIFVAKRL